MSSQTLPGETAILLQGVHAEGTSSHNISKLVEKFQPTIKQIASYYPAFWKDDFIQEGTLGLLNAIQKYSGSADSTNFFSYATTSIRGKMVDFYRHAIGRTMVEFSETDSEGNIIVLKEPLFIDAPKYINEEENEEDALMQIPSPVDYATSTTLGIDFKYHFSNEGLSRNGFSANEIAVFNLHFLQGYTGNEIAEQLKLSAGQVSKLISKARGKAQLILSESKNSNLN